MHMASKLLCKIHTAYKTAKLSHVPAHMHVLVPIYMYVYSVADPEFFCEGGQRGGALIIMVWAWLRILRLREEDVPGVWGFAPAAFYCYHITSARFRCVCIIRATYSTAPCCYEYLISNLAGRGGGKTQFPPPPPPPPLYPPLVLVVLTRLVYITRLPFLDGQQREPMQSGAVAIVGKIG